nr:hypothetical protein L203_03866 [Cryptococcus depauperatus CBS 7841]
MSAITLPPAFPTTGLSIVVILALNAYQATLIMKLPKEAGVKYPNLYASETEAANNPKRWCVVSE